MLQSNSSLSVESGSARASAAPRSRVEIRWHAPDEVVQPETPLDTVALPLTDVRSCTSCGFPVSDSRALCLDCEQNAAAASLPAPLVDSLDEESWLQMHGYTVASLLVTLVTVAIICWLRR